MFLKKDRIPARRHENSGLLDLAGEVSPTTTTIAGNNTMKKSTKNKQKRRSTTRRLSGIETMEDRKMFAADLMGVAEMGAVQAQTQRLNVTDLKVIGTANISLHKKVVTASATTIVISAGAHSGSITLHGVDDAVYEDPESIEVQAQVFRNAADAILNGETDLYTTENPFSASPS